MKNLELWEVQTGNINIETNEKFCLCHNYDADNKVKLFVVTPNLQVLSIDEFGAINWSKNISDIQTDENLPINITYISLSNQVCVALERGELVTIDESGSNYDLVGVFENGLLAMEWSPDQDLLVLVTKDLLMIVMSCTFDPITEVNLLTEDFGKSQFITVGWGKKETQFHGSEGKQAAKQNTQVDECEISDSKVKISWRGDGNFFAVGFQMKGVRRFKVFDREGILQFTSEKQSGLESNLMWRPSGNLIATTQKLKNKYVVAFFEKNGLKHGEFAIPVDSETIVEDVLWSPDSELLTLRCRSSDDTQRLLLFTSSNYHWYLKQNLVFKDTENISQVFWDNDFNIAANKKLHVILQNGKHYIYTWIWTISHSKGKNNKDDAVVGVVDGSKLLLTGFRQSVVPPPMSSADLDLELNIHSIQFAPYTKNNQSCDTNSFFLNTEKNLIFFEQTQKIPLTYKVIKSLTKDVYNFPFQYYNWYWFNYNTVVAIKVDELNCYYLVEYDVTSEVLSLRHTTPIPSAVVKIDTHPIDHTALYLQLNTGQIIEYRSGGNVTPQEISFKAPCPQFDVVSIKNNLHFLGLSHKGNLYIDDLRVINNISSYFVHSNFLLITTLQHLLLCTELTQSGLEALMEYQKSDSDNVYKRKIERGAKLVIAVPDATNTIFQMPRGNLETIQPRPLSLRIIGDKLDLLDYEKAFDLMRKQRINLNLIHDHNPKMFFENIGKFLDSIKNNSWLCLFLSDLENCDVTKTMYSSSYINSALIENNTNTKIVDICDAIQKQINKRNDKNDKILPLLMTYIKKNTIEDLENALLIIKQLKAEEMVNNKPVIGSEEAIKFLLYMVNVDELFNVALGMYDFDLVLLVANKSQKDPKEYIPMLNELNGMDENYKKFSINKYLKRYDRAVQYLAKCGEAKYDDLKTFVKYHSLYRETLQLFNSNEHIYKEISEDFGSYLKLKKDFIEAGIVYERSKNYIKAVDCYKEALEWELALSILNHLSMEQQEDLCWYLVNALKNAKRHNEALVILEQHLRNTEEAIHYAVETCQYKTAIKLCSIHKRPDLRDKLLSAIIEEYTSLQNLIEKNSNSFIKYRVRLSEVRQNKLKNKEDGYSLFNSHKDDDLYSDAGSTIASSTGSGRSYRSSKNRRKHQRKVASLKEGSQYEDVALIMALHNLITASFNLRLQVKDVNIALNILNKDKLASQLQKNLDKLLNEMKESFKQIWTNDLVLQAAKADIEADNIPEGSNIIADSLTFLEPQVRIAPIIQDWSWKLEDLS
ncbi:elongator complex protein 1 [Battus philenor]|uniref:elongator complex protein 1 n=1 Tax=Battus philenor TaxID=42288 RepID=UPI0035D06619